METGAGARMRARMRAQMCVCVGGTWGWDVGSGRGDGLKEGVQKEHNQEQPPGSPPDRIPPYTAPPPSPQCAQVTLSLLDRGEAPQLRLDLATLDSRLGSRLTSLTLRWAGRSGGSSAGGGMEGRGRKAGAAGQGRREGRRGASRPGGRAGRTGGQEARSRGQGGPEGTGGLCCTNAAPARCRGVATVGAPAWRASSSGGQPGAPRGGGQEGRHAYLRAGPGARVGRVGVLIAWRVELGHPRRQPCRGLYGSSMATPPPPHPTSPHPTPPHRLAGGARWSRCTGSSWGRWGRASRS